MEIVRILRDLGTSWCVLVGVEAGLPLDSFHIQRKTVKTEVL
jgi:hypothetical protein